MKELATRNWHERFEISPDRWVHVPTTQARTFGRKLARAIRAEWNPPDYYANFSPGGHVSALRRHTNDEWFIRADIERFYSQIGRNRIVRCMKDLCRDYESAWRIGVASTVMSVDKAGPAYVLPFGFPQSSILAARALRLSALGDYLHQLRGSGCRVTVHADDIVVSSARSEEQMSAVLSSLREKATRSRFSLNELKTEGPSQVLRAFNIDVGRGQMRVSPERLAQFRNAWLSASIGAVRVGLANYVGSISEDQRSELTGSGM